MKSDGESSSTQIPESASINCPQPSSSVYRYLRSLEMEDKKRPLPNYMETVQEDITANTRADLVDWLVKVSEACNLVSETLYLTVSYIDRFLSSHALNGNKLQLLGVSCFLIASEYKEINPPNLEELCFIADNRFTCEEIVDMKEDVLKFLENELSAPTAESFLKFFMKVPQFSYLNTSQLECLICYLAELSLLDYRCVKFPPSVIASSAAFLSRLMISPNVHPWSMELQSRTGYKPSDLKDCVLVINDLLASETGIAVRLKYKEQRYQGVGELPVQEVPSMYFETITR